MTTNLLADLAQIFVGQASTDLQLDYSEASIKRVDQLLSTISEPGTVSDTLVLSVGAYLGETVCRALGGDWQLNEEITDSSVLVNGCELWPFRRVRQRLYYGTERPLYAWLEMAKSAATSEIQKLLQGQEQATIIRPTGHDPLVIQVKKETKK
ncbi:MAG TPA: hypothetical protein VFV52_02845 [Bacilli bacterium]|nr:hypothetical protein [Bacilli bacterium]